MPWNGLPLGLAVDAHATRANNPAESLSAEQSLRAYTSAAARAEFQETRKGKLAPGMLADLAVLSQDIFAVSPDALPERAA